MSGVYSIAMSNIYSDWKKFLDIPNRHNKGTPYELTCRIKRVSDSLNRGLSFNKKMRVGALYSIWFELEAEWMMKKDYPEKYAALNIKLIKAHEAVIGDDQLKLF